MRTSRLCWRAVSMQSSKDICLGIHELVWDSAAKQKLARAKKIPCRIIAGRDWAIRFISSNTHTATIENVSHFIQIRGWKAVVNAALRSYLAAALFRRSLIA